MDARERDAVSTAIEHLHNYNRITNSEYEVRSALAALRSIDPVAQSPRMSLSSDVPEGDSLTKLLADMDPSKFLGSAYAIRPLHERLRALLDDCATEPENVVITGSEVPDLPPGSLVVACRANGKPAISASVRRSDDGHFARASYFRVLHRAPEPVKVGEVATGERLMSNDVPFGTVVVTATEDNGSTYLPLIKTKRGWEGGWCGPLDRLTGAQYQVLRIGGVS